MQRIRVVVTGAAGQIGYALLFRLASGDMFGPSRDIDLVLLEVEAGMKPLEGVVKELEDCAFPRLKRIHTTSDPLEAMDSVHYAVLVGAAPRKAGMERSDLLALNGGIFKAQGAAINARADRNVRVLVVGNPCNTNALVAMHHAPDVPSDRFHAMTALDEKRALAQLALRSERGVSEIKNVIIWGNHSSTQYPDVSHASIGGRPVSSVIQDTAWLQHDFILKVQQRGAEVIAARGASSAASAANAAIASIHSMVEPTPEGTFFSLGCRSSGEYGIRDGLIYSFPCVSDGQSIRIVSDLACSNFSREKMKHTEEELWAEYEAVAALGLI